MSCSALYCSSRTLKGGVKNPDLSFHAFPKCPEIRSKWIKAIELEDWEPSKYSRLCSKHFDKSSFITGLSLKKLKSDAVPTIFDFNPSYTELKLIKRKTKAKQKPLSSQTCENEPEVHRAFSLGAAVNEFQSKLHAKTMVIKALRARLRRHTKKALKWSKNKRAADIESEETDQTHKSIPPDEDDTSDFHAEMCYECAEDITGIRYVCVQCADVSLCASCEARQAHQYHYMLRIPPDRPQSEVEKMVQLVRDDVCLFLLSDASAKCDVTVVEVAPENYKTEPNFYPHDSNELEQSMLDITIKQITDDDMFTETLDETLIDEMSSEETPKTKKATPKNSKSKKVTPKASVSRKVTPKASLSKTASPKIPESSELTPVSYASRKLSKGVSRPNSTKQVSPLAVKSMSRKKLYDQEKLGTSKSKKNLLTVPMKKRKPSVLSNSENIVVYSHTNKVKRM